jgi:HAD superfamily hydrolase (TIGR01509 family)
MKKYKCVIFDCDGILVDSEPLAEATIVTMTNELGIDINIEYAKRNFKGDSFNNILNHIESNFKTSLPYNFESEYRRRSFEMFTEKLKPVEGVLDVIKSLNIPFCVASSGPQDKIRHNLELTGLLPYFEGHIFSCYDIQKWKPEPDIFLHAAKNMGFSVNECVVIEDTIIGITAAIRGGFDVFGFADGFNFETYKSKGTKAFTQMNELKELLTT